MRKLILTIGGLCALFAGAIPLSCPAAEAPAVSAASAVLLDADSGRVLFAKDADTPRAIASTTKLMTALVASEYLDDLRQEVTIRKEWTGIEGTSLYLEPGEQITVETLLYGLLLQSGNDAAVALAGCCAGDVETFVDWMNQRAADLGMTNTHFTDPNGLGGEDHYASALDMAKLGAACLDDPVVSRIAATRTIHIGGRSLTNHNKLLWQVPDCTGLKTGYTRQAGRTLVSSAERNGQRLVCVTLNDGDDWRDHAALLEYGFSRFPRKTLVAEGQSFRRVPVTGSLLHDLPVVAKEELSWPLKETDQVRLEISALPDRVAAPVNRGEIAGGVRLLVNEKPVTETYLVWGGSAGKDVLGEAAKRSPLDLLRSLTGQESPAMLTAPSNLLPTEQ